jgi:MraZ protein
MFLGEYRHTLDEKGRVTLPAKYRPQFSSGLVMTTGSDRCILVYASEEFGRLADQVNALPLMDREASTLRRQIFVNAFDAALDKQGRVIVPEKLREYAGIATDVVVTGVGKFVEVWSPEEWDRAQAQIKEHAASDTIWARKGI